MATKITKAENFTAIREVLVNANRPELVAVIDHELELLANKANRRTNTPTKAQKEGAILNTAILDVLKTADTALTIPEIISKLPNPDEVSHNKVSAQLTKLINGGSVTREIIKRVRYYKAV